MVYMGRFQKSLYGTFGQPFFVVHFGQPKPNEIRTLCYHAFS